MTGHGHHWVGILVGAGVLPWVSEHASPLLVLLAAWIGGTAPDWLEIPLAGTRLIPHRRVTHWALAWALGTLICLPYQAGPSVIPGIALGFCFGGLSHVIVDLPNPMGIPLFHPWRRSSLRWWKSGQNEFWIISAFLAAGVASFVASSRMA